MISPAHQELQHIATRIDATKRLLQCTRSLLDDDHRPILDMTVRQLRLCVEGTTFAARRAHRLSAAPSSDLITDVYATTGDDAGSMSPGDLVDSYVNVRLHSARAALLVVEIIYLESDEKPLQMIGAALFECLHWLSVAREDLDQYAGRSLGAHIAA